MAETHSLAPDLATREVKLSLSPRRLATWQRILPTAVRLLYDNSLSQTIGPWGCNLLGPPWASQKTRKKKSCNSWRAKTAPIERFQGVKHRFRHRSLLRLVRAPAMLKNDWHEYVRQPVVNLDKSHERSGRPDMNRDTHHELKRGPTGRRSSNARHLGCVFQDMKPPKSILRKSSDMQKPIQRVKFTKAVARHTTIRDQNPSLGYICPGEPHQRSPNAPKFEDRSQEETEWQEQGAREAARKLAKSVLKLKEHERATFFSPSENRCLPASSLKPEER